jgi:hypothetical protein
MNGPSSVGRRLGDATKIALKAILLLGDALKDPRMSFSAPTK